jgi:hypothetical protein
MGRRELQEHREQLREGKRWLETMLAKTEKMLHMVENKMALTGENAGPAAAAAAAAAGGINGSSAASAAAAARQSTSEDWEFEERERARAKEIQRLEEERERDRFERERREKERREKDRLEIQDRLDRQERQDRERERIERIERERQREREITAAIFDRGRERDKINPISAMGSLMQRERSEAERNRDLLLASRRVSAVSPAPGARLSTTGATASGATGNSSTTGNSTTGGGVGAAGATSGAVTGNGERAKSAWEGDPIMAGVAVPRREQQGVGPTARHLARGLWSFDVRG